MKDVEPNYTKILHNLNESTDEVFSQDPKARQEILREMGYEPEKLVQRGMERINSIHAKQRRQIAGQFLQKFRIRMQEMKEKSLIPSKEKALETLRNTLLGDGETVPIGVTFRDLKKLDKDDVTSILRDINLLEEFDEFKKMLESGDEPE